MEINAMMMLMIKSLVIGEVLAFVGLGRLQDDVTVPVYHEHVIFMAKGRLTADPHVLEWNMNDPTNRRNYMRAREELAKSPVPKGTV